MSYRNPSPPPAGGTETVANVDKIGDTAYSQCWLLDALVSLSSQTLQESDELGEEKENQFCQLWDMTSDRQVGRFMVEKGVCDLLVAPLARSRHYRVREITLGILANLMCHPATAKAVTEHAALRTMIPAMLQEDDISVLTETVRLLRAALSLGGETAERWAGVLPEEMVERLIHIMQSTIPMNSLRSGLLTEHCAHLLEVLYYRDSALLSNCAYTVFPIVDLLVKSASLEEPLLRCLQYLSEEKRAVENMAQCPALPKVIHRVMGRGCSRGSGVEHSLTAVCLSLVCTLLTSPEATDDMCAWLEKDSTITTSAIRALHHIIQNEMDEKEENEVAQSSQNGNSQNENSQNGNSQNGNSQIGNRTSQNTNSSPIDNSPNANSHGGAGSHNGTPVAEEEEGGREEEGRPAPEGAVEERQPEAEAPPPGETPSPKTADKLRVTPRTPVQLVTPTYGTPCGAVPTPSSSANTPQSVGSTPYSLRAMPIRRRRATTEPSLVSVCREMAWSFLYTLANHIPSEGSCVLKYVSEWLSELLSCFRAEGDKHVELAMLYQQHLEKYPHFADSCTQLATYITQHTPNLGTAAPS